MHYSQQYQAPNAASGSMARSATINDPRRAPLAYPNKNCAIQPESYDQLYHTMVAPVAEPNGEGLGGTVFDRRNRLTLFHSEGNLVLIS